MLRRASIPRNQRGLRAPPWSPSLKPRRFHRNRPRHTEMLVSALLNESLLLSKPSNETRLGFSPWRGRAMPPKHSKLIHSRRILQSTCHNLQATSYKLQTASYKLQQPIANSEPHRNTIANNKVESSTNYNHPHPSMVRRAHIPRIREENRCDAQALPT